MQVNEIAHFLSLTINWNNRWNLFYRNKSINCISIYEVYLFDVFKVTCCIFKYRSFQWQWLLFVFNSNKFLNTHLHKKKLLYVFVVLNKTKIRKMTQLQKNIVLIVLWFVLPLIFRVDFRYQDVKWVVEIIVPFFSFSCDIHNFWLVSLILRVCHIYINLDNYLISLNIKYNLLNVVTLSNESYINLKTVYRMNENRKPCHIESNSVNLQINPFEITTYWTIAYIIS